jgi:uncharacterized protein (DUF4415 family)
MKSTGKKNKRIAYGEVELAADEFEPKNVKVRVTMMVDGDVLQAFKAAAKTRDMGYQTLMNQTLRENIPDPSQSAMDAIVKALLKDSKAIHEIAERLRPIVQEEIKKAG